MWVFLCCRLLLFPLLSFFFLKPPLRISDSQWTQRSFMLRTSVYFQSGDVNAALLLYVARQTDADSGLVSCCCCNSWCRGFWEGGGAIKRGSPTLRASLWRRKVNGEGYSTWRQGPPQNPLYLPTTGVCFPALNRPGTRTLKNKTFLYLDK